MSNKVWKLVHAINRYEVGGLSTEEAVGFLANLPADERANWWGWKPGFADWVQCIACAELEVPEHTQAWLFNGDAAVAPKPPTPPPFKKKSEPPAPPAAPVAVVTQPTQLSEVRAAAEKKSPQEKRKHPRVNLRVKVVVVHESRTFRSYSKNISKGGLLLENKVPWSLPGQACNVFLTNEETSEHIEFSATVVSDASNPFRISFEVSQRQFQDILQKWLNSAQERGKKAA